MTEFVARRIRFRNGEHYSVLARPGGLPVHEVTLFLSKYRTKGRAANTIHSVCMAQALLYCELAKAGIELLERLRKGEFLTIPELHRLVHASQYWADDLSEDEPGTGNGTNVIDIKRIQLRRKAQVKNVKAVSAKTQGDRIRYMADFLKFLATYVGANLPASLKQKLAVESDEALEAFRGHIPPVPKRAKLGAREGLSEEDQARLVALVNPDSPDNPWKHGFVRYRNWLIIVLLLATGMRRGELLGIQIGDLHQRLPKLKIIRRADASEDPRSIQPNTKTNDREVELRPAIMRAIWTYIEKHRRQIKAARKHPQLIVADDGKPLSLKSIDKIFSELRAACPGLPVRLTSHVMRHTWNERFSEQADLMGLSDAKEEKARNEQQGWTDNSKTAAIYTRRHTSRKGRELSLKLQEKLDVPEK
ncbi:integrase [Paraburkholderia sp. GAS41]|uniref:tyrosine-type recombinase/integrase n=1 Tax=Paraburkholderia sp. GAS41 TaxID=3035134 RepID=UPI003D1C914B